MTQTSSTSGFGPAPIDAASPSERASKRVSRVRGRFTYARVPRQSRRQSRRQHDRIPRSGGTLFATANRYCHRRPSSRPTARKPRDRFVTICIVDTAARCTFVRAADSGRPTLADWWAGWLANNPSRGPDGDSVINTTRWKLARNGRRRRDRRAEDVLSD